MNQALQANTTHPSVQSISHDLLQVNTAFTNPPHQPFEPTRAKQQTEHCATRPLLPFLLYMQCSRGDCRTVCTSSRCRQVFGRLENAVLRKTKAIEKVVWQHHLRVTYFSQENLIKILRHLVKQGVFESNYKARSIYPELFAPPAVQQETEQVPGPSSVSDRDLSIMEEQKAWLRK